jgi:multidrug resistance efflux pump
MRPDNTKATEIVPARRAPFSPDVREFMGRAPHWMVRSGFTVLTSVLAVLLALSIVIRYPDTINARITVTGTQPVVEVVARQSGHLESLRVKERQRVKTGDILAVVQSPARAESVLSLAPKLAALAPSVAGDLPVLSADFAPVDGLGKLQDSYGEFLNACSQLKSRLADGYAERAGALLRQQLAGKRAQISSLHAQTGTSGRELALAREKFERMKVLRSRDSISVSSLQEHEMALLQQVRSDTVAQRALTEAEIEAAKTEKELRDLEHERSESLRIARDALRTQFNKLRGELEQWDADYVLRAPADGLVAFYDFWSDQQYVTQGRQVFLIVPETTRLVGRMSVSHGGAGKIKPGQPVRVRFDDFPYKEFGIVTGRVQSVSMVAREGANLVLVDLPHPLTTSFKKQIQFKQDMAGEGNIVTEDIRFIARIFAELRRAVATTE